VKTFAPSWSSGESGVGVGSGSAAPPQAARNKKHAVAISKKRAALDIFCI